MTNSSTKLFQEMMFSVGEAMGLAIRHIAAEKITPNSMAGINDSFGFTVMIISEANEYYHDTNWIAWHTCSILEQLRYAMNEALSKSGKRPGSCGLFVRDKADIREALDKLCDFNVSVAGHKIECLFLDNIDEHDFDYYEVCSEALGSIIEILKPYATTPSITDDTSREND